MHRAQIYTEELRNGAQAAFVVEIGLEPMNLSENKLVARASNSTLLAFPLASMGWACGVLPTELFNHLACSIFHMPEVT